MRLRRRVAMGMAVLVSACGGGGSGTSSLTYSQTVSALTDEGLNSATKGNTVSDAYNALLTLDISGSDVDTVNTTMTTFVAAFAAYNTNIQNVRSYGITTFALSASESVAPPAATKGKPGTSVPGSVGLLAGQSVAVTATAIPVISGCTLSYTVAGTDGYAAASSPTTDAAGQITFTIPGGAANVHDVVNITASASGNTTTLGYAFQ